MKINFYLLNQYPILTKMHKKLNFYILEEFVYIPKCALFNPDVSYNQKSKLFKLS